MKSQLSQHLTSFIVISVPLMLFSILLDHRVPSYPNAGVPKGVMLSQRNLFNSLKSFALSIDVLCTDRDTYIAFLPLAHVLEMLCEMLMVIHGVRQARTIVARWR